MTLTNDFGLPERGSQKGTKMLRGTSAAPRGRRERSADHPSPARVASVGAPYHRRRIWRLGSALAALSLLAAACSGGTGASGSGGATTKGTVSFALAPGFHPNYIMPIEPAAYNNVQNFNQFQFLLYRPLYWPGINGTSATNYNLSLAYPAQFSDNNTVVTIRLKNYRWSDGTPVTSRDVSFFINLVKATKLQYGSYTPGQFPDDIASVATPNAHTVVLHLNHSYNPQWIAGNDLFLIQPMPQHVWDKTSADGKVGNYDETPAGATAVYKFLTAQSMDESTYASNPLWKVVDGPWKMQTFTPSGPVTFVRNPLYSGPANPSVTKFVELPFTTDAAETDVMRAGTSITYGYIAQSDVPSAGSIRSEGYSIAGWPQYQYAYILLNYNTSNSAARSEFRQLYVRQALQDLVDEQSDIKVFFDGYGTPTYGPVPYLSSDASPLDKTGQYPFSISAAENALKQHGWKVVPGGADTCASPGTAAHDCGAGIPAGAELSFKLAYYSGSQSIAETEEALKSDASTAGIGIALSSITAGSVLSEAVQCQPTQSVCGWQMATYGGWTPFTDPVTSALFEPGVLDVESYNDPTDNAIINSAIDGGGSGSIITRYENYLAVQLPVIWQPDPDYQVSAISSNLHGATPQDPTLAISPELWYLTK
jgi:peptide/nickel transport system substrate-binding protein